MFIRNVLQWKDAPKGYGPRKTLYNRFIRWSRLGVFIWIFATLAAEGPKPERIMDQFQASEGAPNGCEPPKKGVLFRRIGRAKGGLNSRLYVVCSDIGKPLVMLLSDAQMSDHKGARRMLGALPPAPALAKGNTLGVRTEQREAPSCRDQSSKELAAPKGACATPP